MHTQAKVWRMDILTLVAGLCIAAAAGVARADIVAPASGSRTADGVAHALPAEQDAVDATESFHKPSSATFTVLLPSNGGAMRLPLSPSSGYQGASAERLAVPQAEVRQVTMLQF